MRSQALIERMLVAAVTVTVVGGVLAGCTTGSASTKHANPTASASASQAAFENEMLQNGIQQAGKGNYDDATATFKAILAINSKSKYALYNLGLIAQLQKDDKSALDYYQRAVKVDPKFTSAMYNEAIVLEPTDRAQAESLYQQIVKINPKASTAFLRLSFLYQADGNAAQAGEARKSALALDPSLATVKPTPPKPAGQ